ncbi:uncharacterized protein LOC111717278 [Eurytemora carolleeae]|uniref:uncharacterized protein LOC111717278 n=1 Tax=Eurytemora carolleeae TaxID=1294199 RepID=UPI000C78EEA2|nr:uncharacterized protein LOC111717278 [Eurytemora carolleeae]|eukprot:XP_023348549.1 uncharacterized protein LOC111717278 [Eurytemora affinis]
MAEIMEEDKVTRKEEISTAEDTCTVFVVGEDVKEEITENQGEIVKIEEDPLFSEQKILKKRKLTDKRDKSYACGKCDYVATQLCHLKTHTDQAYICLIHF